MSDVSISNMFMPDGRDLDSVFYTGPGTQTLGFLCIDGVDIGAKFIAGSSNLNTGYKAASGKDISYYLLSNAALKLASPGLTISGTGTGTVTSEAQLKFTGGSGKYRIVGVHLGKAVSGTANGLSVSGWTATSGNTNPVGVTVSVKSTTNQSGKVELWATVRDSVIAQDFEVLIGYVLRKQKQTPIVNPGDDYSGGEQSTGDVDAEGEAAGGSGSGGSGSGSGTGGNESDTEDGNVDDGSGDTGPGASGGSL